MHEEISIPELTDVVARLSALLGPREGGVRPLEGGITNVQSLSAASAGNIVFESHQTLRAKRTVLVARGLTLVNALPAAIPDRAGTSAVLPSFSDIRVNISADFDVGSGLTFAFGYNISYGVPNAPRTANAGYGRAFTNRDRATQMGRAGFERALQLALSRRNSPKVQIDLCHIKTGQDLIGVKVARLLKLALRLGDKLGRAFGKISLPEREMYGG